MRNTFRLAGWEEEGMRSVNIGYDHCKTEKNILDQMIEEAKEKNSKDKDFHCGEDCQIV